MIGTGATAQLYSRTPTGRLLGIKDGSATATIAGLNQHGDLRWTFNAAGVGTVGNTAAKRLMNPFGVAFDTSGSTANIGFQADYTDPTTNDVWMGARWYNPNSATFRIRDTYPGELRSPITLNRYTYAHGNPLKYFDPDGRCPECADYDASTATCTDQACVDHVLERVRGDVDNGKTAEKTASEYKVKKNSNPVDDYADADNILPDGYKPRNAPAKIEILVTKRAADLSQEVPLLGVGIRFRPCGQDDLAFSFTNHGDDDNNLTVDMPCVVAAPTTKTCVASASPGNGSSGIRPTPGAIVVGPGGLVVGGGGLSEVGGKLGKIDIKGLVCTKGELSDSTNKATKPSDSKGDSNDNNKDTPDTKDGTDESSKPVTGVGGLAKEFDADELAQLTYQHVGAGDVAGRPSLAEIQTAIQRGILCGSRARTQFSSSTAECVLSSTRTFRLVPQPTTRAVDFEAIRTADHYKRRVRPWPTLDVDRVDRRLGRSRVEAVGGCSSRRVSRRVGYSRLCRSPLPSKQSGARSCTGGSDAAVLCSGCRSTLHRIYRDGRAWFACTYSLECSFRRLVVGKNSQIRPDRQ